MSESEIIENYEKYRKLLLKVSSRREQIERFLEKYGDRIATAPGHDRASRHAAAPGGLVKRCLTTLTNARDLASMRAFSDKEIDIESIIVVSLLHDIGRIGDDVGDFYVPQTSSWHIERGNLYTFNPDIRRMTHTHRGLYFLQSEGIPLLQEEWMAIISQPSAHDDGKFYLGHETPLMALLHAAIRMTGMLDIAGPE